MNGPLKQRVVVPQGYDLARDPRPGEATSLRYDQVQRRRRAARPRRVNYRRFIARKERVLRKCFDHARAVGVSLRDIDVVML